MSRKSDIVSAAGLLTGIFSRMMAEVRKKGGSDEHIHRLTTPEADTIWPQIADLIVGSTRQAFKVVVGYTRTLKQMIHAGNYDWVNPDINEMNFKVEGQGKQEKEVVLFHFGRSISSEDAISEMSKAGYRPAKIEELLALGAAYPELQKEFPIVALGSAWQSPDGNRRVPCLLWFGRERYLDLYWFGLDWDEDYRFAAVRK